MQKASLTKGNIFMTLLKLSLPIMGTSFIQMAYNMTDMIWIGFLGTDSVAAVGTAGFFGWLSMAFIRVANTGAAVGVAQSVGASDDRSAKAYISNSFQMAFLMAVLYGIMMILFKEPLIAFFKLDKLNVVAMAETYLGIVALGMVFTFVNPVLTSVFTGYGDSKTPFIVSTIGLVFNMVMDPVLIFGLGPFPVMGVKGAAIATVISQMIVTSVFIYFIKVKHKPALGIKFFTGFKGEYVKKIFDIGFPVGLQSGIFTLIAMVLARIIAGYGSAAIAVQKVGSQIEAISWMSAHGFATALSAFTGQNFGAKEYARVKEGVFKALSIMVTLGIVTSAILIFLPRQIFMIFIREEATLEMGVEYLRILGVSQLFMCIEITVAGAFNGLGRTIPPSIVSMVFTAARLPLAILFASTLAWGLNGVWWSISVSSVLKGIVLLGWFLVVLLRNPTFERKIKPKLGFAKATE